MYLESVYLSIRLLYILSSQHLPQNRYVNRDYGIADCVPTTSRKALEPIGA